MARITGNIPGGCCANIQEIPGGFSCTPDYGPDGPGKNRAHCYKWYCRVDGTPGETVTLRLTLPEYDPRTAERDWGYWFVHSFAEVAEQAFFTGSDELHWRHVDPADVEKDGFVFTLRVTLPECGYLFVSLCIPFTAKALKSLCEEFAAYKVPLCSSGLGQDVPMFRFGSGKNVIWLQANQHVTEVSGSNALTALMRRLAEPGTDLKDFSFFVIPSVAVDKIMNDVDRINYGEDINRNWGHLDQPETAAIHALHEKLIAEGCRLLVMIDMHNGWCRAGDSGGNYTEYTRGFISDEYWFRRVRFAKALLASTDYERPDKLWWNDYGEIKTFFKYGSQNYRSLCSTMEFSRYELWNRAEEAYEPVTQEGLERVGRELADFLLSYDYDLDYEQGEEI